MYGSLRYGAAEYASFPIVGVLPLLDPGPCFTVSVGFRTLVVGEDSIGPITVSLVGEFTVWNVPGEGGITSNGVQLVDPVTYGWLQANNVWSPALCTFLTAFPTGSAAVTRANYSIALHAKNNGGYEFQVAGLADFVLGVLEPVDLDDLVPGVGTPARVIFDGLEAVANASFQIYRLGKWDVFNAALAGPWADCQAGVLTLDEYIAIRSPLQDAYVADLAAGWWTYREAMANALFDSGDGVSVATSDTITVNIV